MDARGCWYRDAPRLPDPHADRHAAVGGESASDAAAQHGRRRVLVDLIPAGQAVLDRVLPEVQQLVTAVMGTPDDQALNTLLDHLTVVRQAITAAPTDLPPPAPRRTPPQLRCS
jgi:hypothetical protein